jgi:hypothetical protein
MDAGGEPPSEGEKAAPGSDRPKRRGRGRGRQKPVEAVKTGRLATPKQEPGAEVVAAEGAEDAELEDVRSLSNWNVPSWNELIASLYRPER